MEEILVSDLLYRHALRGYSTVVSIYGTGEDREHEGLKSYQEVNYLAILYSLVSYVLEDYEVSSFLIRMRWYSVILTMCIQNQDS